MSHIPSSVMKHAGPTHHEDAEHAADAARTPAAPAAGIGTGAWIAIGGTLLAGAAAAIAVPLLRKGRAPVPSRRGRKATAAKGKPRKTAKA